VVSFSIRVYKTIIASTFLPTSSFCEVNFNESVDTEIIIIIIIIVIIIIFPNNKFVGGRPAADYFLRALAFSMSLTSDSLYVKMSPSHLVTERLLHTQISSATCTPYIPYIPKSTVHHYLLDIQRWQLNSLV